MPYQKVTTAIDRYTEMRSLCERVRKTMRRMVIPLAVVIALELLNMLVHGRSGVGALALMGASSCIALVIWSSSAIGLPLLPFMVLQTLVVYGVPIVANHDVLASYPPEFIFSAGTEVLAFNLALALSWSLAMRVLRPSPPVSYVLQDFNRKGVSGWSTMGFAMVGGVTFIEALQGLGLMDAFYNALPSGIDSILNTLLSVASACGFFLVAMVIGGGGVSPTQKFLFWILLVANSMISAAGLLLASAAANLITVAIGLFWSSGRVPWRFLATALLLLSFFNIGKTTMRERYWSNEDSGGGDFSLRQLPSVYAEWVGVSYDAITDNSSGSNSASPGSQSKVAKNQTLLDRIDNLQNLLFVIDAVKTEHIEPLGGATYSLIPPLLVPRVLWPDKPRSHEGQVLLNVHFGRQDLNDTFTTYIAWGLLAEAYGNFGPILGCVYLGIFLGFFFAWIENLTAKKLVVSTEGFLSLCLLISLMNSFEMVASVFVTSTFQSMAIIVLASTPFVRRTVNPQPENEG
jgi:hypothetical protein